jgi:glyoxylase-like metal-dependent hydrolase (beta-lactamase superfamily II)
MAMSSAEWGAVPLDGGLLQTVDRELDLVRAVEIATGVWCLRLPTPYRAPRSVNVVLLDRADGGKVLVDTGNRVGLGIAGLERGLALASSGLEEVSELFCTHLHPDHAEAAPALIDATGVPFVRGRGLGTSTDRLHSRELPVEERRRIATRAGVPVEHLELIVEVTAAEHGAIPIRGPDRELDEGDTIEAVSGSWELVPAHGHSPNQYVLYERRRRWMIGADVAYEAGRPFFEWGHSVDPAAEYLEAVDRIGALPCDLFVPGHGAPEKDPRARFRGAREAALDWWRTVRDRLSAGPADAYQVTLSRVGHDPDPDVRQSGLASVLAVLDHLGGREEAVAEEDGGVVRWSLTGRGRERLAEL